VIRKLVLFHTSSWGKWMSRVSQKKRTSSTFLKFYPEILNLFSEPLNFAPSTYKIIYFEIILTFETLRLLTYQSNFG
jgi:hypothetical protein